MLVMAFPSDFPAGRIMMLLIATVERDAALLCSFTCRLVLMFRDMHYITYRRAINL
jgi:hypothetical protein